MGGGMPKLRDTPSIFRSEKLTSVRPALPEQIQMNQGACGITSNEEAYFSRLGAVIANLGDRSTSVVTGTDCRPAV